MAPNLSVLSLYTRNTLHREYTRLGLYIEYVEAESWLTIVNIMVQVQDYLRYTLFNILWIITHNIIIINSLNRPANHSIRAYTVS